MEVKDNGSNIGDIDVSENELEQWIKKNQHDILILLPSVIRKIAIYYCVIQSDFTIIMTLLISLAVVHQELKVKRTTG